MIYVPTAATRTIGDDDGGVVAYLGAKDNLEFVTGENATIGLDVLVTCATSDTAQAPTQARITGYYSGTSGHPVLIYAYNWSTETYDHIGTMTVKTSEYDYVVRLSSDHHDDSTGEMRIRFSHLDGVYSSVYYLSLNCVFFDKEASVSLDAETLADVAAIKAQTDLLTAGGIVYQGVIDASGKLTLYAGQDYAGGQSIVITRTGWAGEDVDGLTGKLRLQTYVHYRQASRTPDLEFDAALAQSGTTVTATIALAADETVDLWPASGSISHWYQVVVEITEGVAPNQTTSLVLIAEGPLNARKLIDEMPTQE